MSIVYDSDPRQCERCGNDTHNALVDEDLVLCLDCHIAARRSWLQSLATVYSSEAPRSVRQLNFAEALEEKTGWSRSNARRFAHDLLDLLEGIK